MLLVFRPMDSVFCTADHGSLDFLCQRFSSCFVTKPVNSETYKQNGCRVPTMVLSEAHGLSLFRVIREGLGSSKRLCARDAQRLAFGERCAASQSMPALGIRVPGFPSRNRAGAAYDATTLR